MDFLAKLDALMAEHNLNKHKLSMETGIPYTTINGWYKRGYEQITFASLNCISQFFGVSAEWLMAEDDRFPEKYPAVALISNFAERMREYRESMGMSLSELGDLVGLPPQTLNRYELGQRVPKVDVVAQISESLDISPLWLMGYDITLEDAESRSNKIMSTEKPEIQCQAFSERLRNARLEMGLTQQQISDYLGIDKSTYSGYELRKREPNHDRIRMLTEILNTSSDELLGCNKIDMSDCIHLGEQIVAIRTAQRISQKQLAELLGVSPTRLNYWEKGKRNPSPIHLKAIAEVLHVSVDELLGSSDFTADTNGDTEHPTNEFGSILRDAREKAGLSVEEVSSYLTKKGYRASAKTIYSWETSRSRPTPEAFIDLCGYYGIDSITDSFGANNDPSHCEGINYNAIVALKKKRGLTNSMISERTGITISTLDKITSGVNVNPTFTTLQLLAGVLDCSLDDFSYRHTGHSYSNEAFALIRQYESLDEDGKLLVRMVINTAARAQLAASTPDSAASGK